MTGSALAAGWGAVRDRAMTMREHGDAAGAYNLVVSTSVSGADKLVDRDFVGGFLALRAMGRPDLALPLFTRMATETSDLKSDKAAQRARAGYWLARTLSALGRSDDASRMYAAAAAYRDTFYGQMSASMLKLTDTTIVLASYADRYPDMDIFWHDPRVRRELVLAIIKAESSFKQTAVSSAGAKGLMQLMPGTAKQVGRTSGVDIDLKLVAKNGHYNVAVGSKLCGDLLSEYSGNVLLMAAAYNAGSDRADEWIKRFGDPRGGQIDPVDFVELIPFQETRLYVQKVVAGYVSYLAISASRQAVASR